MSQRRNQKGNREFLEMNENENTTYQNLQDAVNAVLKGKFIGVSDYVKKKKKKKSKSIT